MFSLVYGEGDCRLWRGDKQKLRLPDRQGRRLYAVFSEMVVSECVARVEINETVSRSVFFALLNRRHPCPSS
ncbi:unnamed protein product [Toxocara canis]|uniref:Transposase n=1 Tax=Toxocara canis TaxID=6265 RepID=A0A183U250_TOXCA|nr:unnamed protein product [Toxocara canis]